MKELSSKLINLISTKRISAKQCMLVALINAILFEIEAIVLLSENRVPTNLFAAIGLLACLIIMGSLLLLTSNHTVRIRHPKILNRIYIASVIVSIFNIGIVVRLW
jgi:hypothetical protein